MKKYNKIIYTIIALLFILIIITIIAAINSKNSKNNVSNEEEDNNMTTNVKVESTYEHGNLKLNVPETYTLSTDSDNHIIVSSNDGLNAKVTIMSSDEIKYKDTNEMYEKQKETADSSKFTMEKINIDGVDVITYDYFVYHTYFCAFNPYSNYFYSIEINYDEKIDIDKLTEIIRLFLKPIKY